LLTAPPAGLIWGGDPACRERTIRLQELAHDLPAEPVQAGERGHIRDSESRVRHVEVFLVGGVNNLHHQKTSTPTSTRPQHTSQSATTPSFAKSQIKSSQPNPSGSGQFTVYNLAITISPPSS